MPMGMAEPTPGFRISTRMAEQGKSEKSIVNQKPTQKPQSLEVWAFR